MVKSCVQLMSKPLLQRFGDERAAIDGKFDAEDEPSPRTSRMKSNLRGELFEALAKFRAARANVCEKLFVFDDFRNSSATAQIIGPPPKVVPCRPGETRDGHRLLVSIAPSGRPAANGLATRRCPAWKEISDKRNSGRFGRGRTEFRRRSAARRVCVARARARFQNASLTGIDAAFTLDGFENYCANGVVEFRFEIGDIVELDKFDAGNQRLKRHAIFFRGGDAEGAEGAAVERILHRQDAVLGGGLDAA